MAFIEFETEEAYNEAISAKVSEAVETAINDKNQAWLPDRLKKAHDNAVEETKALYADYDQLKESSAGFETERSEWETSKAEFEKKIAELSSGSDKRDLQIARLNAALKYGISVEDSKRIMGDTADEIEADAKAFAAAHPRTGSYPVPDPEGTGAVDGVTAYLKKKYPNTYK